MQRGPGPETPAGFETVRVLGHGATGVVVLARQLTLDRLVAIKLLHAGAFDETAQARLEREGRALVSLRHRHIIAAYQLLPTGTGFALVMEYAPGGDLRSAAVRPPPLVALDQLAQALEHAHAAGIVHRDVKPANALLAATGEVKLADFGLARLSVGGFRTSAGAVTGTPAYLAPEQIRAPELELPASDTYALAVLAYQLLLGRHPFAGRSGQDLVLAHLHDQPPSPQVLDTGVRPAAAAALLAGLAKRPEDRPGPCELVAALTGGGWSSAVTERPLQVPDVPPPLEQTDNTEATDGRAASSAAPAAAGLAAPAAPAPPRPKRGHARPARVGSLSSAARRIGRLGLFGLVGLIGLAAGYLVVTVVTR